MISLLRRPPGWGIYQSETRKRSEVGKVVMRGAKKWDCTKGKTQKGRISLEHKYQKLEPISYGINTLGHYIKKLRAELVRSTKTLGPTSCGWLARFVRKGRAKKRKNLKKAHKKREFRKNGASANT